MMRTDNYEIMNTIVSSFFYRYVKRSLEKNAVPVAGASDGSPV